MTVQRFQDKLLGRNHCFRNLVSWFVAI